MTYDDAITCLRCDAVCQDSKEEYDHALEVLHIIEAEHARLQAVADAARVYRADGTNASYWTICAALDQLDQPTGDT